MTLLIFALIVVIIVALLVWAVDSIPMQPPLNVIARVVIIIIGVLLIADRAGLL
jgi:hypothetical protein